MSKFTILEKFYCQRISLFEFLHTHRPSSTNHLTEASSKIAKKIFICAKHDGLLFPRKPINNEVFSSTEDIIHLSIDCILKRKIENVLTQGIRFKSEFSTQISLKGLPNIVMTTYNSSYHFFKTTIWENFHKLLGDELLFFLLSTTSIFIALPRKCFFQLTGIPLTKINAIDCRENNCSHVIRAKTEASLNSRTHIAKSIKTSKFKRKRGNLSGLANIPPTKKRRIEAAYMEPLDFSKKPVQVKPRNVTSNRALRSKKETSVNFTYPRRSRIFYAKNLSEGLHKSHILKTTSISNSGILSLATKIFGLKENLKRTPKYLIPICGVLKNVVKNFQKSSFQFSLNHHCPLPTWLKKSNRDKRSKRVKLKTHNKIFDSIRYKLAAQSYLPIEKELPQLLFLFEHKVFLFLRFSMKKLLKPIFENCPNNEKVFLTGLKRFIFLGRYEKLSVEKLTATFKISSFDWLISSRGERKHVQQQSRDAKLLKQLILWLYNDLIIPIISSYFYVTETGCHRNKVVYYRKSVWNVIQEKGFGYLLEKTFKELSPAEVKKYLNDKSCLGVYELRLLPSIAKVRPIANLSKCYSDLEKRKRLFINTQLKPVQLCVQYEIERNPCLGATVTESNTIYNRVISFLTHVRNTHSTIPPFYIATLDISRCFDSLPIEKLLEIIPSILKERSYSTRKFTKVQVKNNNYVSKRLVQYACDSYDCDDAIEFLNKKIGHGSLQCYNTVFIERPCSAKYSPQELLALIKKLSISSYRGKYFLQDTGVPQGSVLATLLNNFLLGHIERTDLYDILVSPNCLLMRWIDDYFFVALSKDVGINFIRTLSKALNRFGYLVNYDKSAVNFDASSSGFRIRSQNDFIAWCGYLVNTETLEFSFNYSQYVGENLRDSMTIEHNVKPGQSMCRKLLLAASVKATPLIYDTSLNSVNNQHVNIYQVFRYIALRFYTHFKILSRDPTLSHRISFYMKTVDRIHEKFHRCLVNNFLKSKRTLTDETFVNSSCSYLQSLSASSKSKIDMNLIRYLCYQAFIDFLEKKKSNLGKLVSSIKGNIKILKRYDTIVDIELLRKHSTVFSFIKTRY